MLLLAWVFYSMFSLPLTPDSTSVWFCPHSFSQLPLSNNTTTTRGVSGIEEWLAMNLVRLGGESAQPGSPTIHLNIFPRNPHMKSNNTPKSHIISARKSNGFIHNYSTEQLLTGWDVKQWEDLFFVFTRNNSGCVNHNASFGPWHRKWNASCCKCSAHQGDATLSATIQKLRRVASSPLEWKLMAGS